MDTYFNKQLTERERINHRAKFHDVRGAKGNRGISEDSYGGKVSMHDHRRATDKVNRKSFNENLNPLRNFIRCNVGRPWNKVFSELNKVFDRRKVINDHIFSHLVQYVELDAKLINGKVCVLNSYRNYRPYDRATGKYGEVPDGYYDKRWTPIKEDSCEWYVHPVDGLLKANAKVSKKARKELQLKAQVAAASKLFRVVDRDNHLYLEDGIWTLFTIKDTPAAVETTSCPPNITSWAWATMTKEAKSACGIKKMVVPTVRDWKPRVVVNLRAADPGAGRYYASQQTTSRKLLKRLGLEGTATWDEDKIVGMSHREASRYH